GAVVWVVSAAGIAVLGAGGSAEAVRLEPVGSVGVDPFAENMTVHEVASFPDAVKRVVDTSAAPTSEAPSSSVSTTAPPTTAPPAPLPSGGVVRSGTAPGL